MRRPRVHTSSNGGNRDHARRIAALEGKVETMQSDVSQVKTDTAEILALLQHSKSVVGFAKKHAPRVIAFGLGWLVMGGYIAPQTAHHILQALGLA